MYNFFLLYYVDDDYMTCVYTKNVHIEGKNESNEEEKIIEQACHMLQHQGCSKLLRITNEREQRYENTLIYVSYLSIYSSNDKIFFWGKELINIQII